MFKIMLVFFVGLFNVKPTTKVKYYKKNKKRNQQLDYLLK
jgi:hypothetical protein